MNTTHVDAYFEALSNRDNLRIVPHIAENIPHYNGCILSKSSNNRRGQRADARYMRKCTQ